MIEGYCGEGGMGMLLGKMSDSYIHGSMPNMRIDISMAPHILGWQASYPLSQKGAVIGNINRSLHLAWVPIQAILVQHFFHLQYAQHLQSKALSKITRPKTLVERVILGCTAVVGEGNCPIHSRACCLERCAECIQVHICHGSGRL